MEKQRHTSTEDQVKSASSPDKNNKDNSKDSSNSNSANDNKESKDSKDSKNRRTADELDTIEKSASVVAGNGRESIYCLSIIGQVEGHYLLPEGQKATKYEQLIPLLISVEEDDAIDGLLVVLNTMGGDVEAGLALAELIASMRKPTVTLVLGGGHSIGVPLAVAGQASFIVPSATMTIHPVRINGTVIGAPQTYRYFQDMQARIGHFICAHSRVSPETLQELMMRPDQIATDVGTILEGREAVEIGLIGAVGGLDAALDALRSLIRARRSGHSARPEAESSAPTPHLPYTSTGAEETTPAESEENAAGWVTQPQKAN